MVGGRGLVFGGVIAGLYIYSVAAQAHNVKAMVDLVSMGGRGHNIKLSPQYKGQLYIILVLISLPTIDLKLYHISPTWR